MFNSLNATGYKYNQEFYNEEFENILSKIIYCCNEISAFNAVLPNNENGIRDYILKHYLKNTTFKNKFNLNDFHYDKETDENTGRVDIRILPVNPYQSDDAYYIIECKRLDSKNQLGKTGLNGEYISQGVNRFVSQKYSCYYCTNGLIGFVVDNMDIEKNITFINRLLSSVFTDSNTINPLSKRKIKDNSFDFSYYSTHSVNGNRLLLYHLMINFSNCISN